MIVGDVQAMRSVASGLHSLTFSLRILPIICQNGYELTDVKSMSIKAYFQGGLV